MQDKRCYNCKMLNRYYERGVTKFSKTDFGWCRMKCENVEIGDTCDMFEYKTYQRKLPSLIKVTLNNLFTDISAIRDILENFNEVEP